MILDPEVQRVNTKQQDKDIKIGVEDMDKDDIIEDTSSHHSNIEGLTSRNMKSLVDNNANQNASISKILKVYDGERNDTSE